jgi:hypothetical protein
MSATLPHPDEFTTNTKPELTVEGSRVQYEFNSLVARNGTEFVFLDYLFDTESKLSGAVGKKMRPVHENEAKRLKKRYKNKEKSPAQYQYKKEDTSLSWSDWIDNEFELRGNSVIFDTSFENKYGDVVEQMTAFENIMPMDKIALVECLGGSRMFDGNISFDVIYDEELLRLIEDVEERGLNDTEI